MSKIVSLFSGDADPNDMSGRIILNNNMGDKPFVEIEGNIPADRGVYMLTRAIKIIMEDGDE